MIDLAAVLSAVLPVFLIMGSGFFVRRLGWLSADADASLLKLTINLFMPCLVFDSLLGNEAFRHAGNVVLPPLVGFGGIALGLVLGLAIMRIVPERHPRSRSTFAYTVAVQNYGYIPLPLAMALFDRETVAVLFVHNVGVEIAFWVFGLLLLSGAGLRQSLRRVANAPLIAIVATLVLNLFLPRAAVPLFVMNVAHLLGQCAIPVGVLVSGAIVADHAREFTRAQGGRVMLGACVLRLLVLPLLFLGIAQLLPISTELGRVIVLQAAMPAAVFPIVLSRHYGGDTATALRVVLATSLAALVTIPLWIRSGLTWLGL